MHAPFWVARDGADVNHMRPIWVPKFKFNEPCQMARFTNGEPCHLARFLKMHVKEPCQMARLTLAIWPGSLMVNFAKCCTLMCTVSASTKASQVTCALLFSSLPLSAPLHSVPISRSLLQSAFCTRKDALKKKERGDHLWGVCERLAHVSNISSSPPRLVQGSN